MTCVKEGFLDVVGRVGSKFQAMTSGNILFGEIIGIAVDAVSGATAEYEADVARSVNRRESSPSEGGRPARRFCQSIFAARSRSSWRKIERWQRDSSSQ